MDPALSGARIAGLGIALPVREVSSIEIASRLGVTEEWIVSRTGIAARRLASEHENAASLGATACRNALASAHLEPSEVDMIVCATITAGARFPATGCLIGAALGTNAPAWDLNAGCSGFLFALAQADALVRSGSAARVLVVGTDVMSKITDHDDPKTAILFGDGAGAVLVERSDAPAIGPFRLFSDGTRPELLYTDERDLIRMRGREVYRAAVDGMTSAVRSVLTSTGIGAGAIDLLIAHQANQRILDAVVRRLGLEPSQVVSNIDRYGNTSAASIPLALFDAQRQGRLRQGDVLAMTAFGAGFCWGAGLVRWFAPLATEAPALAGAARA